jgi:hypothetical protein
MPRTETGGRQADIPLLTYFFKKRFAPFAKKPLPGRKAAFNRFIIL